MNAQLLHQSKYIKAVEFGIDTVPKEPTWTIGGVKIEELEKDDNTVERKGIVRFAEIQKGWVLNVTNLKALIAMFGNETDDWNGKRVTLYAAPETRSETGVAVRVRGSPDLEKPVTFTAKVARKNREFTLVNTAPKARARQQRGAAQQEPTPWQKFQACADELGFDRGDQDVALIALFRGATSNKPSKELTEDDWKAGYAALDEATKEPPAADNDPPLTGADGTPF